MNVPILFRPEFFVHGGCRRESIRPAADIWSFGCTVFEAATCQRLMGPLQSSRSSAVKTAIHGWCSCYPELIAQQAHAKQDRPYFMNGAGVYLLRFVDRLSRVHDGFGCRQLVLQACDPIPGNRKFA